MPVFLASQVQHKWNVSHELHVPKKRDKRPPTSNGSTPATRPKCSVCAGVHSWPPEKCRRTPKVERKESPQSSKQPATQRATKTNARRTESSSDSKKVKPVVCHSCGREGHKKADCRQREVRQRKQFRDPAYPQSFSVEQIPRGRPPLEQAFVVMTRPRNPRRFLRHVGC